MVPDELDFEGRPQLVARFRGSGGGRTLLLNGHVDVVDVEPRADWTQPDPFAAVVRDGLLYGRGACDMKGGVASMVIAACALAELGVPLAGDLIVNTVTEEESTGAGGAASPRGRCGPTPRSCRSRAASSSGWPAAAACCRASPCAAAPGTRASTSCRREQGGAVNAIEKMAIVLEASAPAARALGAAPAPPVPLGRRLRADDRRRRRVARSPTRPRARSSDTRVPRPTAPTSTATARSSSASSPVDRRAPRRRPLAARAPARDRVAAACRRPRSRPTTRSCRRCSRRAPTSASRSASAVSTTGTTARPCTVEAGIPVDRLRPGRRSTGATRLDEYVPVDDLVACAQRIALAAVRFCGTA